MPDRSRPERLVDVGQKVGLVRRIVATPCVRDRDTGFQIDGAWGPQGPQWMEVKTAQRQDYDEIKILSQWLDDRGPPIGEPRSFSHCVTLRVERSVSPAALTGPAPSRAP